MLVRGSLPPLEPTLDLSSPPSPPLADAGAPSQRAVGFVDSAGQPVEGVSVLARPGLLTLSSATGNAASIGELGVLPGVRCRFPDDVIAGQNVAAGRIERATASSSSVLGGAVIAGVMLTFRRCQAWASARVWPTFSGRAHQQRSKFRCDAHFPTATALRVVLRLASPVECAESLSADASESLL